MPCSLLAGLPFPRIHTAILGIVVSIALVAGFGCKPNTYWPRVKIVGLHDYTAFSKQGFLMTPYDYKGY